MWTVGLGRLSSSHIKAGTAEVAVITRRGNPEYSTLVTKTNVATGHSRLMLSVSCPLSAEPAWDYHGYGARLKQPLALITRRWADQAIQ